ncbi:MAG: hypothetical protein IPI35_05265 [Deltaproteobacteria bacterium]|nr:hypothetical protein [Deltaproteobacteria bacterium]
MRTLPCSSALPALLALVLACGDKDSAADSAGGDSSDSAPVEAIDADGDGAAADVDCDDADPTVAPGLTETCDGRDQDCDGEVDEDAADATGWRSDVDGDGYGAGEIVAVSCEAPAGSASLDGDCDDSNPAAYPGAPEDCEVAADLNCDGSIGGEDGDADGVVACEDCDDTNAQAYPGNVERADDGVDGDCDGLEGGEDRDGDGLNEVEEAQAGTDPLLADTDGDGLSDGDERGEHGTDPLDDDSDGDGASDGAEVLGYTDPTDATDKPYIGGWEIDACRGSITSTGTTVGKIAPSFSLTDQHGDKVKLHDFCGKVVLLDFGTFW